MIKLAWPFHFFLFVMLFFARILSNRFCCHCSRGNMMATPFILPRKCNHCAISRVKMFCIKLYSIRLVTNGNCGDVVKKSFPKSIKHRVRIHFFYKNCQSVKVNVGWTYWINVIFNRKLQALRYPFRFINF